MKVSQRPKQSLRCRNNSSSLEHSAKIVTKTKRTSGRGCQKHATVGCLSTRRLGKQRQESGHKAAVSFL